jgi:Domain of unknown function (DUF4202)
VIRVIVSSEVWLRGELLEVDRQVHAAQDSGASFSLFAEPELHPEVALRYQRLVPRSNAASATPAFHELLQRHRRLHDLSLPLVRADYDHALDAWQWALRLDPAASAEVQIAALLHDIERLASEPRARVEHLAPSYAAFKDAHAERGAQWVRALVQDGPWDVDAIVRLVRHHERRTAVPGGDLVGDADVLSFFALNSPGYLRYFGAEVTGRKVRFSLARASARARPWLGRIRLHPLVRAMVDAVPGHAAAA